MNPSSRTGEHPPPSRTAFSLIEMLFVVAIIGLLAALVLPRVGGAFGKSQVKTTRAQIEALTQSVEQFRLDTGRYPTEEEGLLVLINKPDGLEAWQGPYLQKRTVPADAWGRPFVFQLDEQFGYVISSLGADGQPGGEGENEDLDNRS